MCKQYQKKALEMEKINNNKKSQSKEEKFPKNVIKNSSPKAYQSDKSKITPTAGKNARQIHSNPQNNSSSTIIPQSINTATKPTPNKPLTNNSTLNKSQPKPSNNPSINPNKPQVNETKAKQSPIKTVKKEQKGSGIKNSNDQNLVKSNSEVKVLGSGAKIGAKGRQVQQVKNVKILSPQTKDIARSKQPLNLSPTKSITQKSPTSLIVSPSKQPTQNPKQPLQNTKQPQIPPPSSLPTSPVKPKTHHSPQDIERLKFLKRIHQQKQSIQQKLQQQKLFQEEESKRTMEQEKKQKQRKAQQEKAKKQQAISARLQEMQQNRQKRKRQLSLQNKEYLQKKREFTLQHRIINQWVEKQLQQNKLKEKQLQDKIRKMKPANHLQQIQDHIDLIESYKLLHHSRLQQEDRKFEQRKSRAHLQNLYKSNWYKQIQQSDPSQTFKVEEQKRKEEKQLLLMKLDNKKKYSEYVKVNYKPDVSEESVFTYRGTDIRRIEAEVVKRMGLENLSYCKEHGETRRGQMNGFNKAASEGELLKTVKSRDYLQELKTQRRKRENLAPEEDFDQLVQSIKNSTSLSKEEKVKRISLLAQKMQQKAREREEMFNRTKNSRLRIMQNQLKDEKMKRGGSLPNIRSVSVSNIGVSEPKLKQMQNQKSLPKSKNKSKQDDFIKEINDKLILLKKI